MTRDALVEQIDEEVTNKTAPESLTAEDEGENMKDILDHVQPYKKMIFDLDTGALTATYIHDDFPSAVKTVSSPSNGVIRITGDASWQIAGKTTMEPFVFSSGGAPYFATASYNLLGTPLFRLDINLVKFDGTQTATPSEVLRQVEIRVYP